MERSAHFEKEPLLGESKHLEYVPLKYSKWLTYSVVIAISFMHLLSYVLSMLVLNQYTYYKFMKQEYPDATETSENLPSCTTNTTTVQYQKQVAVQKMAAEWSMICNLCFLLPGIFSNINLGTFSDVYGRRLFFIIPLAGSVVKSGLCALAIYYEIDVRYLLIFYMIEASTGSWIGTLSMSLCFIADTTEPGKRRSLIIGLLEGGLGIGGFTGIFISGYLISWTNGYFYPDVVACCVVAVGLCLVLTMVQESLHESRKRKQVSFLQNMKRVTECFKKDFSPTGKPWMFIILMLIFDLSALSNLTRNSVETLYYLNTPFCWDSVKIGVYTAVRLCFWNLGAIVLIRLFHICTTDEIIALAGCVTTVASLVVQGMAESDSTLYIAAVAGWGCIATMPVTRSIMSQMTPADRQGSTFAGVAAVEALCALAGGVTISGIYNATVDIYRGMVFIIWSGFGVCALLFCIIFIIGKKRLDNEYSNKETDIKVGYKSSQETTKIEDSKH